MSFNLLDDIRLIDSLNKYVSNAYSVIVNNENNCKTDLSEAEKNKSSLLAQEKAKLDKQLSDLSNKELEILEKENSLLTKIQELSRKLESVDKKYVKVKQSIDFAGVEKEKRDFLIGLLQPVSDIGYKSLSPIKDYFETNSYKYISKPVSPLVILTKKRRNLYETLASCTLVSEDIFSENKAVIAEYIGSRKANITNEANSKIAQINDSFSQRISSLQNGLIEDRNFVFSEVTKGIASIIGNDFQERYRLSLSDYENIAGKVPSNDVYPATIFLGDIAWPVNSAINFFLKDAKIKSMFETIYQDGFLFLPWESDLGETQNFFFAYQMEKDKSLALNEINKLIFRFIEQIPVNGLEITIFDPTEKGNSVYPFLSLSSQLEQLFSKKIFTSTEEIDAKISEFNAYIDSVIQQKLSNRYENVVEYNKATPENPLPIRLLVCFDFPKYIEGRALEKLVAITSNAYRAGIFTIFCLNPFEIKESYAGTYTKAINDIKDLSIFMKASNGALYVSGRNVPVSFPDIPNPTDIDSFGAQYFEASKKKANQGVSFASIQGNDGLFGMSSKNSLLIPVGKGDGSTTLSIEFGKLSSQHALITGATGSGKSTLLHTMIMSSLLNYSPDELNLYLMDFKSGTEFKVYETIPVPHIKLLALDAMQEFGESILEELIEEQKRRSTLFKENGECTNIKAYIEKTGEKLPRILVVMDEFQILFNDSVNRKVANHCAELANKIVTEGRAFGIHLVMATQTLRSIRDHSSIQNSTIEQMRIRIGLKCNSEDASLVFGDANAQDAMMHMKGAIGTAVYNPEYTELNNSAFRTAYCPEDDQKKLLIKIQDFCKDKWETKLRVFEGKREPVFPYEDVEKAASQHEEPIAVIGEPIKVGDPIRIKFSKRRPSNTLIVGANEDLTKKIMMSVLSSLVKKDSVRTHLIYGDIFVDEDIPTQIKEISNQGSKIDFIKDRKDILLFIEALSAKLKKRKKGEDEKNNVHIVYIHNFNLCDILCAAIGGDSIEKSDYIEGEFDYFDYGSAMKELIETGGSYGIFFVIDNPDYQAIQKAIQYGAGCLEKFPIRILYSVSERDSDFLIGGVSTKEMNPITALYTDGLKDPLQFKPYIFK